MDLEPTLKVAPSHEEFGPMPESIGAYKIQSLLKRGGMSLVYLATHPKTGQTVIVKVVLPKYLKNKEMLSRLLREAKILSLTTHPNIVKLYDLGRGDQGLFIVMEYVQGVSLRQFLKRQSFTHKRALEIILEIAYAIAHLHSHGVIHRDLKPDNILITESGQIKLIDFGISQFIETEDEEDKTENQARMGTPHYMSPEQKEKPFKLSYSTDIFSLGVVAYELYLGHPAHGVVILNVLPKPLQKILGKALEIDPANRYQDIIDFIADISGFMKKMDETEPEKVSDEAYEIVIAARNLLLPSKTPNWPEIDIGMHLFEGRNLSGIYFEFFRFSPTRYGLVFAQAIGSKNDPAHLISLAMLCGTVRTLTDRIDFSILPFLTSLNRALMQGQFSLFCLTLDKEKNQLAFASCGVGELWHFSGQFSSGKLKERKLEAKNPSLGHVTAEWIETKENWNSEDTLLFSSFAFDASRLSEHLLLTAQPLTNFAVKTLGFPKQPGVFATLKRL